MSSATTKTIFDVEDLDIKDTATKAVEKEIAAFKTHNKKGNMGLKVDDFAGLLTNIICDLLPDLLVNLVKKGIESNQEKIKDTKDALDTFDAKFTEVTLATKLQIERAEQESKCDFLRIHNVPESSNSNGEYEDVYGTTKALLEKAKFDMNEHKISVAYRIGKQDRTKNTPRPIIVKMQKRSSRNFIMRNQKTNMRENTEFQSAYNKVFITEDLTKLRQHIAYTLRINKEKVAKTWSINGIIKCTMKSNPTEIVSIDSPFDLKRIDYTDSQIHKILSENLSYMGNLKPTRQQ